MSFTDFFTDGIGKKLVQGVLPTLGTALGGPLGGAALGIVAKALYPDDPDNKVTADDIAAIVKTGDPETLLKLRQAEYDFQTFAQKMEYQTKELDQKDKDSARNMAIKTSLYPQIAITITFLIGFFCITYFAFTTLIGITDINPQAMGSLLTLLGVITTAVPTILAFWFGGNKSNQDKDDNSAMIQNMLMEQVKRQSSDLANSTPQKQQPRK